MDAAAGTQRQQPPLPTVDSLREAADVHWVSATALTWVNVRVDPRRDSEIAGVIPPDTRVELGQSRSGWTHVRASGISGWVGRRMFMPDSAGHPR
jgi:SH3-like domain-containing protein